MAFAEILFVNPNTGARKIAPVGYSWTTLFFFFFPALLRGHWMGVLSVVLISIVLFPISWPIIPFFYNGLYIRYLISNGFMAESATHSLSFLSAKLNLTLPINDIE